MALSRRRGTLEPLSSTGFNMRSSIGLPGRGVARASLGPGTFDKASKPQVRALASSARVRPASPGSPGLHSAQPQPRPSSIVIPRHHIHTHPSTTTPQTNNNHPGPRLPLPRRVGHGGRAAELQRPARKSSTGLRKSTAYGHGGRQDPRPNTDKAYIQTSIRGLINYLTDHEYDHPFSTKILQRPTAKDFTYIVSFLFRQVDSNFRIAGKLEDEVIAFFKVRPWSIYLWMGMWVWVSE